MNKNLELWTEAIKDITCMAGEQNVRADENRTAWQCRAWQKVYRAKQQHIGLKGYEALAVPVLLDIAEAIGHHAINIWEIKLMQHFACRNNMQATRIFEKLEYFAKEYFECHRRQMTFTMADVWPWFLGRPYGDLCIQPYELLGELQMREDQEYVPH